MKSEEMTCEIAGEKKNALIKMASTHCASLIAGNLRISAPETRSGQNTDTCTQKLRGVARGGPGGQGARFPPGIWQIS